MKNLPGINILIILCLSTSLFSQQLSPSVISSSGGFYTSSSAMLSFTTGEMSAIETYAGAASILTQGFQQPWDLGTYINEHPFQDFSYGIYPNPSNGEFYLLTDSDLNLRLYVSISDLVGKKCFTKEVDPVSKINVEHLDVQTLPAGTYILSLRVKESNSNHENIFNTKITIVK